MSKRHPTYLDHNATTPVLPEVVDAMLPYLSEHFGNPSSGHVYGRRALEAVATAREKVADLLGCRPREIFFTSGGTEANNLAIRGGAAARPDRTHIITSVIEHPATEMPCAYLERLGYDISRLPVNDCGMVDAARLAVLLRVDTLLVTVMHANSETGTLQPIRDIVDVARQEGAIVHTDAAQTTGRIPFMVDELGVDLLSVVGHKMYAPKGIGALYVREGTELAPQLLGGGHEHGLRSGTENVPCIIGLGKACEIASRDVTAEAVRIAGLRDRLWELLKAEIPGLELNGHRVLRLPNTLNVRFPGVSGNAILANAPEIAASTGSACHADDESASQVIRAMGLTEEEALGSVRLTLGRGTTHRDIAIAVPALTHAWRTLAQ